MPARTRSKENQGKIAFRTRKSLRSGSLNVKNVEDLEATRSHNEMYRTAHLGPSQAVELRVSSRRLFVGVAKIDRRCKLSPVKPTRFASNNGIPSPRKRLFQDGKILQYTLRYTPFNGIAAGQLFTCSFLQWFLYLGICHHHIGTDLLTVADRRSTVQYCITFDLHRHFKTGH